MLYKLFFGINNQRQVVYYVNNSVLNRSVHHIVVLSPIPVKIHGSQYQFRYQSKTQMLIKNTLFLLIKSNKNQCHSLYLFKIVFQVFPQVIKYEKQ